MPSIPFTTSLLNTSTDTPTESAQSSGVGPTASLDKDPYSIGQVRFPLEGIGTNDIPHWVLFNINLPTSSKYFKQTDGSPPPAGDNMSASQQNYNTLQSQGGTYAPVATGQQTGTAVALTGLVAAVNSGIESGIKASVGGAFGAGALSTLNLQPKLKRISQSISIYMPETVAVTYSHEWESLSATEAGGDIGKYAQLGGSFKGAITSLKDIATVSAKNLFGSEPNKAYNSAQEGELAGSLIQSTGAVGPGFSDLEVKSMGKAVNPHVEMMFKRTNNRQYTFVFHFIPRSQKESVAIYNIIKGFKAFAAPEVSAENGGRYFIPPAQFDISFYFMQAENPSIARISTCALTQIDVNYSGEGSWTTFNDGSPLKIDLNLQFTEMDIIVRELIQKYGY